MKSPLTTLAIGLLAACGATSALAQVQWGHSAAGSMQTWDRTSQGMSTNAALAFYRMQNMGRPATSASGWTQYTRSPVVSGASSVPVASAGTDFYRTVSPTVKPFAYVRPPTTAFDRYWPYMMEGYEDPETGYIIWTLP